MMLILDRLKEATKKTRKAKIKDEDEALKII